jgi:hypothetical protein
MKVHIAAHFNKQTKDSKRELVQFHVKGDKSSENSYEFYRKAGSDVVLEIAESQMSIGKFRGDDEEGDHEEPREGVRGKVNPDGTIELEDKDQLTLEAGATKLPARVR